MKRLHEEKIVRMAIPDEPKFDPLTNTPATPSGRIELYNETLYALGHQVATYEPPYEARGTEEYPYQFFTGRQRFFMQSMYTDDPLMIKMSGGHPTIRINPVDAKEKGIVEGEKVEVYNDRGHMVAPARICGPSSSDVLLHAPDCGDRKRRRPWRLRSARSPSGSLSHPL